MRESTEEEKEMATAMSIEQESKDNMKIVGMNIPKEAVVTEERQKYLMLGMTEESSKILKYIKSQKDYTPIFMSKDEMDLVVATRTRSNELKVADEFLDDDRHKARAKDLAMQIYMMFEDKFKKGAMLERKLVKSKTNLSWNKFNDMIATLDMFGFIKKQDNNDAIGISIDEKEIFNNKQSQIKTQMDVLIGQLIQIDNDHKELNTDYSRKLKEKLKDAKKYI